MWRSSRNEFVVEGYQVGMWMKRTAERIREKKEQEEKEREKERRRREENEREDKERCRKKRHEKINNAVEKIFEEFNKELKKIQREYRGEKKSVEKRSFDFEDKIQEREVEKEKQENEVKVVEEVIWEAGKNPNILPSSVDSIMQEVEDEIPKEQCSESIEVKLQETNEDSKHASPRKVPCNFMSDMRMRHQVDIIPSAPLLTRPTISIHEEVPPKEIEDKKIFFDDENKGEASEESVHIESVLIIEIKVERASLAGKLKYIFFLSKDACFTTITFSLHSGANSISKARVLMIPRKVSRGFQRIMFDPGG